MEGDFNGSPDHIRIPKSNIRHLESNMQTQLENFEKEIPEATFLASSVCDIVKNQILNYDDEQHLSKTQNNCRRIFIASKLFIGICSVYSHIVDFEYTQIVSDMVQWEKYRKLSKKISYNILLESRREKYFAKEAQGKLLKSLGDEKSMREDALGTDTSRLDSDHAKKMFRQAERSEHELRPEEDAELLLRYMDDTEPMLRFEKSTEKIPESVEGIKQVIKTAENIEYVERVEEGTGQIPRPAESTETEFVARYEKGSPLVPSRSDISEAVRDEPSVQGINETLTLPLKSSFREDSISNIIKTLTEMRAEPSIDTSKLQYPISTTSKKDISPSTAVGEISVADPKVQQEPSDEINQILQILEEQIFQKDLDEIGRPSYTSEPIDVVKGATITESPTEDGLRGDATEKSGSEEWSLPSLEPIEKQRKKHRNLIIDEVTIIPDYAMRALQLNRNINIERIQVYEGPPKVLQAISAHHLMTTPGFKSSFFQDIRSSRLSRLYGRHLKVEKRPVEQGFLKKRTIERQREDDTSKEKTNIELTGRIGMRSFFEKSDVLTEGAPEKSHLEDLGISVTGVHPEESLIGMPVSRIMHSIIEPPVEAQTTRINASPIFPAPRAQQLQGKDVDPKTSPLWFISTKESPPNAKYREFNYVYNKLQNYWSLFEKQGLEKCIALREFLSSEQDESAANFLTLLRVVDKMSIQRKLSLEYKSSDVLIRPFESPYISDRQLLFKEKDPIF